MDFGLNISIGKMKSARCSKVHYPSEQIAWEKAAYLVSLDNHLDLKVYYCKFHKTWHLTTAPVQLHDFFWRPRKRWPRRVWAWFHYREQEEDLYKNVDESGIKVYWGKN